jgi:hypothetical protein
MTGAVVQAGREFKSGANRVRLAQRVIFTADEAYESGTDGSVVNVAAAATQIFSSATLNALALTRPDGTTGVQPGDILVLGVIGGAAGLGANADTLRVHSVTDANDLVVEKLDGSNFAWTTAAALPWRLHVPGDRRHRRRAPRRHSGRLQRAGATARREHRDRHEPHADHRAVRAHGRQRRRAVRSRGEG